MAPKQSGDPLGTIKEKHKLLINPQPNKLVLVLKYPTRQPDELYCAAFGNKPLELRIKPKCGLVEVDVPIDVHHHFDREKGLKFGATLQKKILTGDSNSFYGVSSGLHPGASRKDDDESSALDGPVLDRLLDAFDEANEDGYVMNKITLGGRIEPFKDGDPIYMLATFEEGRDPKVLPNPHQQLRHVRDGNMDTPQRYGNAPPTIRTPRCAPPPTNSRIPLHSFRRRQRPQKRKQSRRRQHDRQRHRR